MSPRWWKFPKFLQKLFGLFCFVKIASLQWKRLKTNLQKLNLVSNFLFWGGKAENKLLHNDDVHITQKKCCIKTTCQSLVTKKIKAPFPFFCLQCCFFLKMCKAITLIGRKVWENKWNQKNWAFLKKAN